MFPSVNRRRGGNDIVEFEQKIRDQLVEKDHHSQEPSGSGHFFHANITDGSKDFKPETELEKSDMSRFVKSLVIAYEGLSVPIKDRMIKDIIKDGMTDDDFLLWMLGNVGKMLLHGKTKFEDVWDDETTFLEDVLLINHNDVLADRKIYGITFKDEEANALSIAEAPCTLPQSLRNKPNNTATCMKGVISNNMILPYYKQSDDLWTFYPTDSGYYKSGSIKETLGELLHVFNDHQDKDFKCVNLAAAELSMMHLLRNANGRLATVMRVAVALVRGADFAKVFGEYDNNCKYEIQWLQAAAANDTSCHAENRRVHMGSVAP